MNMYYGTTGTVQFAFDMLVIAFVAFFFIQAQRARQVLAYVYPNHDRRFWNSSRRASVRTRQTIGTLWTL